MSDILPRKNDMKICFQILSLKLSGGAEKVLASLASELALRGYDVSVVCLPRDGRGSFYPLNKNVKLHYLEGWDTETRLVKRSKKFRNLKRLGILYKMLKKIKPDISVSFLTDMTVYSARAAKLAGIPHISCERNSPWDKPEKEEKRIRRNRAFAQSKACVVQTEAIKAYFEDNIQRKTFVIPNPVTLTSPPLFEYDQRANRIVSVGRITEQKNQQLLINAFAVFHKEHPEYTLEIYGKDFGSRGKLEDLIAAHNLENCVSILDPITDLHKKIKSAKLFVLTSKFEGYPNALAEAVSLGIPCISTDCQSKGPEHILDFGRRGILILPNDADALYNAMNRLVTDKDLAKLFSERGIEFGKHSTMESFVDKWEHIFATLV